MAINGWRMIRILMNIFTLLPVQSHSSKWHTKSNCNPQIYIRRTIPVIFLSFSCPPYNITQAARQKKIDLKAGPWSSTVLNVRRTFRRRYGGNCPSQKCEY